MVQHDSLPLQRSLVNKLGAAWMKEFELKTELDAFWPFICRTEFCSFEECKLCTMKNLGTHFKVLKRE